MAAKSKLPKCGRCGHTSHRNHCTRRGPSGCVPFDVGESTGFVCGYKPPCPCPWRTCKCGLQLSVAIELPAGTRLYPDGQVMLVSVIRWSASRAEGRLAVWPLDDGMLGCRDLADGEEPWAGERRGTEHDETVCGYKLRLSVK